MRPKLATFLLISAAAFFSLPLPAAAQQADVAVVVNSDNPVTGVSLSDLRKYFEGTRRAWPNGDRVKLITREPGTPERLALLRLLAMTENDYKQYWTAQVFRGEADQPPLIVPSIGMQKEALAAFSGGLTLVLFKEVKPGMKVIKVGDMLPGTPGYPVH